MTCILHNVGATLMQVSMVKRLLNELFQASANERRKLGQTAFQPTEMGKYTGECWKRLAVSTGCASGLK